MADLGWVARLRQRLTRGSVLSSAVVIVATGALLAAALDAEGYETPELELHDAGVWLSRTVDGAAIGRFNTQIRQMDVRVDIGADPLLQHDATVWVVDEGALCSVDGRTAKVSSGIVLPSLEHAEVGLGGPSGTLGTGAILDDGKLWVAPSDELLGLGFGPASCGAEEAAAGGDAQGTDAEEAAPDTEGGEGPAPTAEVPDATELVVATDGTAWTYAPRTGAVRGFDAAGVLVGEHTLGVVSNEGVQLSAVGTTPVVLDPEGQLLHLPDGGVVDLSDHRGLVLQLPGPARDRVLLASNEGLLEVPLRGGPPEVVGEGGSGGAAEPLRLGGCSYGAWAAGQTYAVLCDGREAESGSLSRQPTGEERGNRLRIRTNRGRVVVNDLASGYAYLLGHGQPDQTNWDDALVEPEPGADDADSTVESPEQEDEQQKPEARNDTGEPRSGEDAFGTRPDVAVVVHPMRNDSDPNPRDVLVITEVVDDGCECTELVDGGLAVQVTPPPGSSEDIRFTYTISDGIDTASAESLVKVHDESENKPPYYPDAQPQETTVAAGGTVRHNVLTDARDPEGDALSLVVPVAPPKDDGSLGTVTASVDGTITYTAPGLSGDQPSYVGPVEIPFTIGDGRSGGELEAVLTVGVVDPKTSSNAPQARGDHALTVVGHEVVVDVLANDSDADGDPLRVTYVSSPAGANVVVDERGQVRVTPSKPGPLLLDYRVSDGTEEPEAEAKIRVDVLEDTGPVAPLAVRDDVILPAGQVVVVDVLENDADANGDVLIVEGVLGAERVGLAVEVIDHRFLRVRSSQALLGPASFTYSVSDGTARDTATVVVRPGPPGEQQPPTANDDSYRVRAGTIAAFDVLANDTDPEGAPLRLVAESVEVKESSLPQPLDDAVFPQDGHVRFAAPSVDEPQSVRIEYMAADDDGADRRTDSAEVLVTIVPESEPNGAPRPPELTARTVAGRAVVIPIPVATMDPDGDDVTLLGIADGPDSAPRHGSVTELGNDRLTYVPDQYEGGFHGTDSFTYRVRDAVGLESVGVVRVGVAQPPAENHPPVAIDDERSASGPITIDVRRNDSDPDGDDLSLVPDSLVKADPDQAFSAAITDNGRVQVDPGGLAEDESATFSYTITDGILEATGRVTFTKIDQAPVPPVALDDRAPAAETGEEVEWDVLANDVDPDGAREDLIIEKAWVVAGLSTDLAVDGGTVRFTMPDADVTIRYRVVDESGGTADAVLRVRWASSTALFPPVAGHDSATTDEGQAVVVDVLENDVVMPGREAQLLDVVARPNGTCTAEGGQVRYQPDPGFSGLGGCSYVVGDGPGDSPDTLRATGTIGVTVVRTSNAPPRFVAQRITVYADDSTTVDLRPAVVDPDDPQQRQRVELGDPEGEPEGISARIEGTMLTVSAGPGVEDGTAELTFTVSDGTDQSAEPGRVVVRISRFDGPLASLVADQIETTENKPSRAVNLLANDRRAIEDEPLSIVRADGRVEGGTVAWELDGAVIFTPDPGYHGVTSFTYTVDDGTGRPDRQVSATVTVTVIGYPDPPAPPTLVRGDGQVSLSWSTPADNGAPIVGYLIEAVGGPGAGVRRLESAATSYTFEGLRNGESYTFRVAARNKAVTSDDQARFSQPTLGIVPNAIPNTPAPPVAGFDPAGGAIDVSWVNPGTNGSPITEYLLRVDPSSSTQPNPIKVSAAGQNALEHTVDGLVNGTAYTFTVQAVAVKADASTGEQRFESAVSAPSVPEVPATKPGAPTKPVINPADLGDRQITVHWERPAENGDPISQYHVDYFVDGAKVGTELVPGTVTQTTIQNTDNDKKYTFAVRAENKAGTGDASPQSDPVNSYGVPGPVASISATEGDRSSVLTFARPPENGAAIDAYQVRAPNLNGGAWTNAAHSTSGTTVTVNVGSLTNGTTYEFQIRAHNARDWATDPGASSNAIRPFGIPHAPGGMSGHNNGGSTTLTWNWSGDEAAQRNGHNDIIRWEVEVQSFGIYEVGSPTYSVGVNPGDCRNVRVRAVGDRTVAPNRQVGQWTGFVQACAPPPPPPPATVTVSQGPQYSGSMYYFRVTWSNLPPGNHTYRCYESNGTDFGYSISISGSSGSVTGPGHCWADASVYGGVYVVIDGIYQSPVANW